MTDADASVMAHSWHIRVRPWLFAVVRRPGDLPPSFVVVRRVSSGDFPKLNALQPMVIRIHASAAM